MISNKSYVLVLLVILTYAGVKCEETTDEIFSVQLDKETFNEAIEKNNHFVMFFAPWCGHCKRLHPLWEQLAEIMNVKEDPKVVIAKVDCTEQQELCSMYEVTGYPTLRFFKLGEKESVKFKGTRDMPAITEFINDQLAYVDDNIERKTVEEPPVRETKLVELTEENFAKHVSSGNHFVKFYAPWCSHCQRLAPTWEALSKTFQNENAVSIAKIDCTVYRPICQDFEVKGYPTLLWIEDGKKIEKYSGTRDHDTLKSYVDKMLGADAKKAASPFKEEQKEDETLKVQQLTGENFQQTIENGISFIKFYAPWCGHCQKLSPTWDQLAQKIHAADKGVTIAKVDCTAKDNKNLCTEQKIEGYPTLFAYKNGVKQSEYEGARSFNELEQYINKLIGHDEL